MIPRMMLPMRGRKTQRAGYQRFRPQLLSYLQIQTRDQGFVQSLCLCL